MPLGLVPGVRTHDQGWPFQAVHHCATPVMVAKRELFCRKYTALTTKLLKHAVLKTYSQHISSLDSEMSVDQT